MALILNESAPSPVDNIIAQNTSCLNTMRVAAKQVFNLFWHSKSMTAQEVCDSFGSDAGKAFAAHAALQSLIYLIDPTWVALIPPKTYTVNDDGTVTVGA